MALYDNFLRRGGPTKFGLSTIRWRGKFFLRNLRNLIGKHNFSLLEVGPGSGYFAELCVQSGVVYKGLESNKQIQEGLLEKGLDVVLGHVPPLPVEGSFDVILLDQVFEHMEDSVSAFNLLESIHSHLRPGGLLLIAVPDVTFWGSDFFGSDYTHTFPLSAHTLKQIVEDAGFVPAITTRLVLRFTGNIASVAFYLLSHVMWNLGLLHLLFGRRAYKVKCVLFGSVAVIARRKDS